MAITSTRKAIEVTRDAFLAVDKSISLYATTIDQLRARLCGLSDEKFVEAMTADHGTPPLVELILSAAGSVRVASEEFRLHGERAAVALDAMAIAVQERTHAVIERRRRDGLE